VFYLIRELQVTVDSLVRMV